MSADAVCRGDGSFQHFETDFYQIASYKGTFNSQSEQNTDITYIFFKNEFTTDLLDSIFIFSNIFSIFSFLSFFKEIKKMYLFLSSVSRNINLTFSLCGCLAFVREVKHSAAELKVQSPKQVLFGDNCNVE